MAARHCAKEADRKTGVAAAVREQAYQQVNYPQMLRESLWIFVDICGSLWIFVDICGYLWIFVDIASSLIYMLVGLSSSPL